MISFKYFDALSFVVAIMAGWFRVDKTSLLHLIIKLCPFNSNVYVGRIVL